VHDKQVRRRRAVLGLLVAVSLILLTAYFGESASSPLHSVQRGFVEVLSPVQDGASKALKPVRDIAGWFSDTFHAKSQADQLRTEVHHLQAEVAQYQTAWEQNQHFAALLKLDNKIGAAGFSPVTSQVISKDPTLWYETIEVNKGSDDGVALNDPVVGDNGLVGKISLVSATASWVTLITDHTMAVAAIVDDPAGDSGVLEPQVGNPNALLLQSLPRNANVAVGDQVVTAGFKDGALQDLYPAGIPIGTVSSASQSSILSSGEVQVTPAVDLRHLDVVQVLTQPHGANARAQVSNG